MKTNFYKLLRSADRLLLTLALVVFSGMAFSQVTYTFNYTGAVQTISLSAGSYSIEMWGADGGNGTNSIGGKGGYSAGTLSVSTAANYYVYVGGKGSTAGTPTTGGWNGGGNFIGTFSSPTLCGTGGGGTDIRTTQNTTYANRIIVAGGGGGGNGYGAYTGVGGNGGGAAGGDGASSRGQTYAGGGGTSVAGGTAATGGISGYSAPGALGVGGDYLGTLGGTAGGGGYFGGGSGHWGGSGGGGSGYVGGVTSGTTIMFGQPGFVTNPDVSGNGLVLIRELCSVKIASSSGTMNPVMLCSGSSLTLTTDAVSNYSWSTGALTNSIVVSPTSNTMISVSGTSSMNCTSSAIMNILVNSSAPVLSISNPSTTICLGRTVSLTATGALSYTWTNPGVVNGQTFTPSSTAAYTVTGQNGCGTSVATTTITVGPLPVSASANPVLVCQGYPATLTAVASATSFSWQPNAPGTSSMITVAPTANTIYTVTASDGTCSGTHTVQVTTKTTPVITTTQTLSTICAGESIVLTANGAGSGGTYSWVPGGAGQTVTLTPTTATSAVVYGTNSLTCTSSAQWIILLESPPNVTVTASDPVICIGEQAVLTAKGASNYQWTNGPGIATHSVSPTAAVNVYTVTGSHATNTCSAQETVTVSVIIPNVSYSSSLTVCSGGQVTFTASGASMYSWNGASPGTSGIYQTIPPSSSVYTLVSTTSSLNVHCKTTDFATVTVNPLPTLTVTPKKETMCKGETHTLTVTGAVTYSWGTAGSGSVITVKPNVNTPYIVTGVDANMCEGTTTYVAKIVPCAGLSEYTNRRTISVYPNPSNGNFVITAEEDVQLIIINELGQHVALLNLSAENGFKVEVKDLAAGVYFLTSNSDGVRMNEKIVVTR